MAHTGDKRTRPRLQIVRGVRSRGTTLIPPRVTQGRSTASNKALTCNGINPSAPTTRHGSGRRLRDQHPCGPPRRFAPATGSLHRGIPHLLPIHAFNWLYSNGAQRRCQGVRQENFSLTNPIVYGKIMLAFKLPLSGEMSEWFKEPVLKTGDPQGPWVRIPLSPPNKIGCLSALPFCLRKYPRGRRGSPAKGVGGESRARVQIPPSAPNPAVLFLQRAAGFFCSSDHFRFSPADRF